jgi:hypothetical protein
MMGSRNKILRSGGTSYPTYMGPLVPIFLYFLTLKASHVRQNEWIYEENSVDTRVDILYRLVPQLILFDFLVLVDSVFTCVFDFGLEANEERLGVRSQVLFDVLTQRRHVHI